MRRGSASIALFVSPPFFSRLGMLGFEGLAALYLFPEFSSVLDVTSGGGSEARASNVTRLLADIAIGNCLWITHLIGRNSHTTDSNGRVLMLSVVADITPVIIARSYPSLAYIRDWGVQCPSRTDKQT